MNITNAIELLNKLLTNATQKTEKKVYKCFIQTLTSLHDKDLTENQLKLIQEKLSSLNLKSPSGKSKKFYSKQHTDFKAYLNTQFSFTTQNYYTEIGMIYGMSLGAGIGLCIGIVIDPALGTSIGMSMGVGIGMVIGMMYGAQKDAEAKKLGRVI